MLYTAQFHFYNILEAKLEGQKPNQDCPGSAGKGGKERRLTTKA